jgi:hypothetical protein
MRLTPIIIILHVVQRAKLGLGGDGVALATLIFVSLACDQGQDVWFAILGDNVSF